jgi:hypothetical protein
MTGKEPNDRDELARRLAALAAGQAGDDSGHDRHTGSGLHHVTMHGAGGMGVDDDTVIVPAPDLSVFQPRVRTRVQRRPVYRTMRFRRTLIPVLMTCGLLLPAVAVWSLLDENAVLADANPTLAVVLSVTGVILLVAWALNVLHVRHELRRAGRPPGNRGGEGSGSGD